MTSAIRQPAVAGMFYPARAEELKNVIRAFLQEARPTGKQPKALIVPHAGYIYSGAIAASAYAQLAPLRNTIKRVVLLGPSHRVAFQGIATSSASSFSTPLGSIPLDITAIKTLQALPQVGYVDTAHEAEHSLEVHLPFLQTVLADFSLVPLVVGEATPATVAQVIQQLWGGDETLIVISTDLSHYHSYHEAQQRDRHTASAIEQLDYKHIDYDDACGRNPLKGLLFLAKERGLKVSLLDLRNSGDTAGPRDQVVGYGAFMVTEH